MVTGEFEINQEETLELTRQGLIRIIMETNRILNEKQIPNFYFTNAAIEASLPPQICRPGRIEAFLSNNKQHDEEQVRNIASIFLRVLAKLMEHPYAQTYHQAMIELKERIDNLKEQGYSHNLIALQAQVSHKTMTDIINDEEMDSHRRHRCPWELLKRLENAEEEIKSQREYTAHRQRIMRPGKSSPNIEPKKPGEYDFIKTNEACLKCGATWTHLYRNGEDNWRNIIMTCITCNKDNFIDFKTIPKKHANGRPRFEPFGPCPNCGAPWANQVRDYLSVSGLITYKCTVCENENVITPKNNIPKNGKTNIPVGGK